MKERILFFAVFLWFCPWLILLTTIVFATWESKTRGIEKILIPKSITENENRDFIGSSDKNKITHLPCYQLSISNYYQYDAQRCKFVLREDLSHKEMEKLGDCFSAFFEYKLPIRIFYTLIIVQLLSLVLLFFPFRLNIIVTIPYMLIFLIITWFIYFGGGMAITGIAI